MIDGENIIWVDSELENLLSLDDGFWVSTPPSAPPFLEPGKVVVDMPVQKAKTKAHQMQPNPTAAVQSYAISTADAPTIDKQMFDVRTAPMSRYHRSHDISSGSLAEMVFATALHVESGF